METCKICGEKLESDDKEYCKKCQKLQEDLHMDDLASNILFSPFNPGL